MNAEVLVWHVYVVIVFGWLDLYVLRFEHCLLGWVVYFICFLDCLCCLITFEVVVARFVGFVLVLMGWGFELSLIGFCFSVVLVILILLGFGFSLGFGTYVSICGVCILLFMSLRLS